MRNLYSKLDVSSGAGKPEIETALSTCPDMKLEADAAAVLTFRGRRRQYDRLNSLLTDIARLRARMQLNDGDNWRGAAAFEYMQRGEPVDSRKLRYIEKSREREQLQDSGSRPLPSGRSIWVVAGVVVALAIAGLWLWLV